MEEIEYRKVTKIFIKLLIIWHLYHVLSLYMYWDLIWGANSFIPMIEFDRKSLVQWFVYFMFDKTIGEYNIVILWMYVFLLIYLLFKDSFVLYLICFILTMAIKFRAYNITDAGDLYGRMLYLISLIYYPKNINFFKKNEKFILKYGVTISRIQLCYVYINTFLTKIVTPIWYKGVASFYVFNLPEYTHPFWSVLISRNNFLILSTTYFPLIFQYSFPLLVWKGGRVRLFYLAIGLLFHLGIILIMGLTTFSIIFMISFILFLDKKEIDILKKIKSNIIIFCKKWMSI